MEQGNLITASVIAVVFAISKFIEVRFVQKEDVAIKNIIRDTIMVYISSVIGLFILEQVSETVGIKSGTSVFVGNPDF
jgi:hypothetical protein|tara:strand:- start:87 stop:320 length:234 start_codon:yes stop_codon:yes gene_type:complete